MYYSEELRLLGERKKKRKMTQSEKDSRAGGAEPSYPLDFSSDHLRVDL